MKKMSIIVLIIAIFFSSTRLVNAACSAEEESNLKNLAANVNANYEIVKEEQPRGENFNPPDGMSLEELDTYVFEKDVIKIHINNMNENMYAKVTINNNKRTEKTYDFSQAVNGTITITQEDMQDINNYTITIYSSQNTNCPNTKLNTLYVITPRYNYLSEYTMCEGIEEFYLCHKYLSVEDDTTENEFFVKAQNYQNSKYATNLPTEEEKESFWDFVKEHKLAIAIGIIAVGGIVGGTIVIIKKQRRKK